MGWRTAVRRRSAGRAPKPWWSRGSLVVGCAAAMVMGVVGCTSIVTGKATVDNAAVPEYRASVSASIATSSSRESQRQRASTTKAVRGACVTFAKSSEEAVTATNDWVEAFNKGGDVAAVSGQAVEALNHSADEVSGAINKAMPAGMKSAFKEYASAAKAVADAISKHSPVSVYNARKDHLNDVKDKGFKLCGDY